MDKKTIEDILNQNNLDIKTRGPLPRPFDQKVTPDVINVIAKSILSLENEIFTVKNIQNSETLKTEINDLFGKPKPTNPNASNEYDKFIGQILNNFMFSGIIVKMSNNRFKIIQKKILFFISMNYFNSLRYLIIFTIKVLKKTNIFYMFENYLSVTKPDKNDYDILKNFFIDFILKYTNISKKLEPRRILGKVLNILAFEYKTYGSRMGKASKEKITLRNLLYGGKDNSRDLIKRKFETRSEYQKRVSLKKTNEKQMASMKKYMKEIYGYKSAVSNETGLQVHHVLMKSQYPEFAETPENLIPLTAQEHTQDAHPSGDFHKVDIQYQIKLLKIQKSIILENPEKLDIEVFNTMLEIAEIEI